MNKANTRRIILASSSPRRQELLQSLKLPLLIHPSNADETVDEKLSRAEVVEALALRKASAVKDQLGAGSDQGIVVGSDTIVVLDSQILGKPADRHDAFRMLRALQGRTHEVYTGVACIDLLTGAQRVKHRTTRVHMKPLDDAQIERYIATGEPMDKAGSYAIQGMGATIVDFIEGDYFNVVGLPLSLLSDMLAELGLNIL